MMSKIAIGLLCYSYVSPETMFDYMRMSYAFGRRYPEHDFFLIYKTKAEQFRARNDIVESALSMGADYLLFLDDDQVIDWQRRPDGSAYDFLQVLLDHQKPIVGCLYYHRGGEYSPVLMKRVPAKDFDRYRFLRDHEIKNCLQEVDVQGGGCMLINMEIFNKIKPPYFEPEMQTDGNRYGTDIQICRKAYEQGFSVWCDTSIQVGHVRAEREIVTPDNRDLFIARDAVKGNRLQEWAMSTWIKGYREDALEYLNCGSEAIDQAAAVYNLKYHPTFGDYEDKADYYRSLGNEQICRQVHFHSRAWVIQQGEIILSRFGHGRRAYGLDFGCGTAPVGFELLRKGHKMDFVDIDGAPAYEFLKWRVAKHSLEKGAGFSIRGPYDFLIFLDSIEHLQNWQKVLDQACGKLKDEGAFITNFFDNTDRENPEHINMDHEAVAQFLVSIGIYPVTQMFWVKQSQYLGGPTNVRNLEQRNSVREEGR